MSYRSPLPSQPAATTGVAVFLGIGCGDGVQRWTARSNAQWRHSVTLPLLVFRAGCQEGDAQLTSTHSKHPEVGPPCLQQERNGLRDHRKE